jgi:hypothetical protein
MIGKTLAHYEITSQLGKDRMESLKQRTRNSLGGLSEKRRIL